MTQSPKPIRLLTYNVFLRPPPIKTNDDDFKHQRINDILNQIDNFDVVCFQELFQTATFRKEKVIQKAISKGFCYWKQCESPQFWQGPPVDSGLLVISRFPILHSVFESYQVGVLSDAASDKGYIYCQILIQNKILHLFTTHLQASYLDPGKMYERQLSIKTRLYQFKTLLTRIKSILNETRSNPKEELVLLMGDLNMNALMAPMTLHGSVLENQKVGKQFIEYDSFMKIFSDAGIKPTNCGLQKYKKHPVTFGDGDTILTDRLESHSKQCLDFIFTLDVPVEFKEKEKTQKERKSSSKGGYQKTEMELSHEGKPDGKKLKPITDSAKVQEFKIKDKPYIQLSDHYGMSIQLCIQ